MTGTEKPRNRDEKVGPSQACQEEEERNSPEDSESQDSESNPEVVQTTQQQQEGEKEKTKFGKMHRSASEKARGGKAKKQEERRKQRAELSSKTRRIANLAKDLIPVLVEEGKIKELPVVMSDDIFLPRPAHEGYHFCVVCHQSGRFRIRQHIKDKHAALVAEGARESSSSVTSPTCSLTNNDYLEVLVQVSRGITENMKRAKIDMSHVIAPITDAETEIYKAFYSQLIEGGVPVVGRRNRPNQQAVERAGKLEQEIAELRERVLSAEAALANEPGSSGWQQQVEHIPFAITCNAPTIPRCLIYMYPGDKEYTGGARVHSWFLSDPQLDLMFKHLWDGFGTPNYFEVLHKSSDARSRNREWMKGVERRLELWRKVIYKRHKILDMFSKSLTIKGWLPGAKQGDEPLSSKGRVIYVQYVCRFMLVAMRSRQRIGEPVSMDDAIFSCDIVLPFFDELHKNQVSTETRRGFAKALIAFYRFIQLHLNIGAGERREKAVQAGLDRAQQILHALGEESRLTASWRGVAKFPSKRTVGEPYGVARAVVTHRRVLEKLDEIYKVFKSGDICFREFNFYLGASASYIVQCNTGRNELIYKMKYGSIFSVGGEQPEDDETSFTGLRKEQIGTSTGVQNYYVGIYPNPKSHDRVRDMTTYTGGFFVLDHISHQLIMRYSEMRTFVARKAGLDPESIQQATSPFFLKWNGEAVVKSTVPMLMQRFLQNCNCAHLNISCNTTRHSVAKRQFEEAVESSFGDRVGPVDPECAVLEGHTRSTQLKHYNDSYVSACAQAYRKLEKAAAKDAIKHQKKLEAVEKDLRVVDLKLSIPEDETEGERREQSGDDAGLRLVEQVSSDSDEHDLSSSIEDEEYRPTGKEPQSRQLEVRRSARKRKLQKEMSNPFEFEDEMETGSSRQDDPVATGSSLPQPSVKQRRISEGIRDEEEEDTVSKGARQHKPRDQREPMATSTPAGPVEESTADQLDSISALLNSFNQTSYDGGLTRMETVEEQLEFFRRREEGPVQKFTWLEVREVTRICGRGVFAKIPIPKGSVVCDYRGFTMTKAEYELALSKLTQEERALVQAYALSYEVQLGWARYTNVVVAHNPTYKGIVTLGRLINYSDTHPNVELQVHRCDEGRKVATMAYFRASKDIQEGQQLLCPPYDRPMLRRQCICEACDPNIGSTKAMRRRSEYQKVTGPWNAST